MNRSECVAIVCFGVVGVLMVLAALSDMRDIKREEQAREPDGMDVLTVRRPAC